LGQVSGREYHEQKQALSRFHIGAAILNESVLNAIKRELKRVSPDVKIEIDTNPRCGSPKKLSSVRFGERKYKQAEKAIERAVSKAARARKEEGVDTQANSDSEPLSSPPSTSSISAAPPLQ